MRKIINKPETFVVEMCNGIALANPNLEFIQKYKILKKKTINQDKVSLISGGGSGHEPAHAGYIGKGMLDAAICGDIFSSPSQIQVYQGIKSTASKKGTLLIIKNYSGDIMNFCNAANMAIEEGITVDFVKVEDDIAVKDSLYTVGRRGVAGTVLVHKVAGAAAEVGLNLEEVKEIAIRAANNVRTIGFAYSSCVVPAAGKATFEINENEMEYGVGIHGEPGRSRDTISSANQTAELMISQLVEDLEVKSGDEVTVLINGMGGTPLQELYVLNNEVFKTLNAKAIKVYREFVGNFMTSIDMLGASISIMKMDETLKRYIDEPCEAPAFRVDGFVPSNNYTEITTSDTKPIPAFMLCDDAWRIISNNEISLNNIVAMVQIMTECIINNEQNFCELDSFAGDGDFGQSVAKGFLQVKREWDDILLNHSECIRDFLLECSFIIMEYCGGASGPIWGSAFRSAGLSTGSKTKLSLIEFANMLQASVKGIQVIGEKSFGRGAIVGDKTLIDALVPCANKLSEMSRNSENIAVAFQESSLAAVAGAEYTKSITAKMGRAGVVGERSLGYPDAGAYALGVIFTTIVDSLDFQ
mgnify:CR=1 FL=1